MWDEGKVDPDDPAVRPKMIRLGLLSKHEDELAAV